MEQPSFSGILINLIFFCTDIILCNIWKNALISYFDFYIKSVLQIHAVVLSLMVWVKEFAIAYKAKTEKLELCFRFRFNKKQVNENNCNSYLRAALNTFLYLKCRIINLSNRCYFLDDLVSGLSQNKLEAVCCLNDEQRKIMMWKMDLHGKKKIRYTPNKRR